MTTYNEITKTLLENGAKELYRFQGHNSFECYDIRNNRFNNNKSHYVYFSSSKNHHYYFTIKRLRQLINAIVLNDTHYKITRKGLENPQSFHAIQNMIFNSDKIKDLNSISLVCDQVYYALIKENCIDTRKKIQDSGIERVDRKVFGGGYGITGPWLDLFNDLTYFSSHTRITTLDVLECLDKLKQKGIQTNPLLIKDILERKQRHYIISENLYNDFHKYSIMNDLERIYQENLYVSGSSFMTNPTKTIKKVLTTYQTNRNQILHNLDKKYHSIGL